MNNKMSWFQADGQTCDDVDSSSRLIVNTIEKPFNKPTMVLIVLVIFITSLLNELYVLPYSLAVSKRRMRSPVTTRRIKLRHPPECLRPRRLDNNLMWAIVQ